MRVGYTCVINDDTHVAETVESYRLFSQSDVFSEHTI